MDLVKIYNLSIHISYAQSGIKKSQLQYMYLSIKGYT